MKFFHFKVSSPCVYRKILKIFVFISKQMFVVGFQACLLQFYIASLCKTFCVLWHQKPPTLLKITFLLHLFVNNNYCCKCECFICSVNGTNKMWIYLLVIRSPLPGPSGRCKFVVKSFMWLSFLFVVSLKKIWQSQT